MSEEIQIQVLDPIPFDELAIALIQGGMFLTEELTREECMRRYPDAKLPSNLDEEKQCQKNK